MYAPKLSKAQTYNKILQTKTTRFLQNLAGTRDFRWAKPVDRQLQSNFFSEPNVTKIQTTEIIGVRNKRTVVLNSWVIARKGNVQYCSQEVKIISSCLRTSYRMYWLRHSGVKWAPRCSVNFIFFKKGYPTHRISCNPVTTSPYGAKLTNERTRVYIWSSGFERAFLSAAD